MDDMMLRATRLTRANRLIEATALIQSMLRGDIDQGGQVRLRLLFRGILMLIGGTRNEGPHRKKI